MSSTSLNRLLPYLTYFWRFDHRESLLSWGLNLLDALMAGIGLLLLLPLLSVAGVFSGSGATAPLTLPSLIQDYITRLSPDHRLLVMLVIFVGLIALQATIQLMRERHRQQLQLRFVDHLRERLFGALARARWQFIAQHHSSEFLSILTADVTRIGTGTYHLSQLLTQLFTFPVYLAVAFHLSPEITGLSLLTGGILWGLLQPTQSIAKQSGTLMSRANQGLFNELQEFLAALKLIKIHGEESGYQGQLQKAMQQLRNQQMAFTTVRTRSQLAFRIGGGLALACLTYVAISKVQLPPAKLLILIAIFTRLLPQLSSLHMGIQQLLHMLPAFDHWQDWVRQCEKADGSAVASRLHPLSFSLAHSIKFENVSYQHPHSNKWFLIPLLRIPARQTTAIIGPTGAGKTTLLDLLCGLTNPASGQILVDGQPLMVDTAWHRSIAYVPQETAILDGTLRDNLMWGHDEMDDPTLFKVLDQVAAGDFVRQLPQRLDTWVGERGVRLSGGERQRLALARALLRQPELLILDEATSALDREHQQAILEALRQLHGRITVIIVTHRHEEIRDLLDGQILVTEGIIGAWQPLNRKTSIRTFAPQELSSPHATEVYP